MKKEKISVSMIVKNESSNIRRSLDSVKGADEIVVIDTGSKDDTIDIVKEYTDKVYYGEEYLWRDDFAYSRNQSLEKCTGDWILIIDADEQLEEGGMEKIRRLIPKIKDDAVYFQTIADNNPNSIHQSIRLFRNNKGIKWHSAIHNYLSIAQGYTSDIIMRYGYSDAHNLDPDRAFRILKKEWDLNPKSGRTNYYLAREYWYRNNYEAAIVFYKLCIDYSKWNPELADAYLMLARCYWQTQRGEEARQMLYKALTINPDFRECLLFLAETHYEPWKSKYLEFAQLATNKNVLFIR